MFYKIIEVTTAKAIGETYVLVHFWDKEADAKTKPPILINDFIMRLRVAVGTEATDPSTDLKANIEAYWVRAQRYQWRGDHSAAATKTVLPFTKEGTVLRPAASRVFAPIQRDKTDPHAVLAHPAIKALVAEEVEP